MSRRAGCYVWRTRKPNAPIGLPIIGRHFAYVGQSNNHERRAGEHLNGSVKYGTLPAPWSDLDPRRYLLPCLFSHWKWARLAQETMWIVIFWPVYNDQKNRWNPRRIKRYAAVAQRAARDKARGMGMIGVNFGRMLVRGAVTVVFWGILMYAAIEVWGK